ncbi:MAG: hypothetical protein PF485_10230 [Bacteroidales bacterium]|jgi:hypothetical protein|nr:hypothetical protein [Bacteroidales bacterium]
MKTNIIIIAISSLLLFAGCSTYEASYEATPLNIDGSSSDWTTTLDSKDNNRFSYGISNDEKNLYIRININDQSIQKKLMLAGLTMWIDTTGKKKEYLCITCPIEKPFPKMDRNKKKQNKNVPEWNPNQLLEVEFFGFKKNIENYFVVQNPYGVEVSIDQDDFKSLYYEMKIPLNAIYSNYSDISPKTLSIGLETGSLKSSTTESKPLGMNTGGGGSGKGSGGGGSRGSGGDGGGSKGGGNPGGKQNSSMNDLSTPTKVWIKNILLAKP